MRQPAKSYLTTETAPQTQVPHFNEAFDRFNTLLTEKLEADFIKSTLRPEFRTVITYEPGKKYIRIVKARSGNLDDRSVYGFIDMQTGDLLKADGWKRPAKRPRGTIFDPNLSPCCGEYSVS